MEKKSFREQNRERRERNAFENLYAYAREKQIPDPKRTAERAARGLHSDLSARAPSSGASSGDSRAGGSGAERKTPHRLDERTKEQLYERAQELDIEGRSTMTKDELVEAIRAQQ